MRENFAGGVGGRNKVALDPQGSTLLTLRVDGVVPGLMCPHLAISQPSW
jgi:hypothetical protein